MWFLKEYAPVQAGSIDGTDTVAHDAAIQRACVAHYNPPNSLTTDPEKTIFVGRLNHDSTEESLRSYFRQFGPINNVKIIRNIVTGISEGYGFVTFEHRHDACKAYDRGHKAIIDDHVVLVDYERARVMKGWIPRRLGGGFGGRKESGQLRFGARAKPFRWPTNVKEISIDPDQEQADVWRQNAFERKRKREDDDYRPRYSSDRSDYRRHHNCYHHGHSYHRRSPSRESRRHRRER